MAFCRNCGAALTGGAFCGSCGSPVGAAPTAAAPSPSTQPRATQPAAGAGGSSGLGKILAGCLVVVVLILLAVGAGVVYVGYRAKKKADEIRQAYKSNDLDKLAGAVGMSEKDRRAAGLRPAVKDMSHEPPLSFPLWSGNASSDSSVPLRAGLTVITAIAQPIGDYESMKRIERISDSGLSLAYRADNIPDPRMGAKASDNNAPERTTITSHRTILTKDWKAGHDYAENFSPQAPDVYPGSTAISVSQAVLEDLKSTGQSSFSYQATGLKGMLGGLLGNLGAMAGSNVDSKEKDQLANLGKVQCTLKRTSDGLHAVPVLLNDAPVKLPAIHAQCGGDDGPADFYVLDNPENPLVLAWKLGAGDALQVIKISYANVEEAKPAARGEGASTSTSAGAPEPIEKKLRETGRAEVYGIYFDFASDKIKPESEAVLQEISKALKDNPAWTLQVNGHTDNIGGDDYNLDLSRRRAAAVKQALVTRHHISADRLATSGFGASQPKEPNDTLYGRARNRRVELIRDATS